MCVQRFDDSLNSAIHITYRISLRSSSMLEPRDPLLKVLFHLLLLRRNDAVFDGLRGRRTAEAAGSPPKQQDWFTKGWRSDPEALTQ